MSTTVAPMTVEQFLTLPEEEGVRRELIDGEVITTAWAGQPHEIVKSIFLRKLGYYLELNPLAWVLGEATYRLGPHDAPVPDVSVVLKGRLQPGHSGLIPICPDIAVEVVSSEPAKSLRAKVQLYLQHGAKVVWVAYPELRMISGVHGCGGAGADRGGAAGGPRCPAWIPRDGLRVFCGSLN